MDTRISPGKIEVLIASPVRQKPAIAAPDIEARLNFVSNLALNTRDAVASIKESMQRLQSLAASHPQASQPPEEEGFEVPVVEPEA